MSDDKKDNPFLPITKPEGIEPLSYPHQEKFAIQVAKHGNKTLALREVGTQSKPRYHNKLATLLYNKPHVKARVQYLIRQQCPTIEFDIAKGVSYIAHAAQDPKTPLQQRIQALQFLNKLLMAADHQTKPTGEKAELPLPPGFTPAGGSLPDEE